MKLKKTKKNQKQKKTNQKKEDHGWKKKNKWEDNWSEFGWPNKDFKVRREKRGRKKIQSSPNLHEYHYICCLTSYVATAHFEQHGSWVFLAAIRRYTHIV